VCGWRSPEHQCPGRLCWRACAPGEGNPPEAVDHGGRCRSASLASPVGHCRRPAPVGATAWLMAGRRRMGINRRATTESSRGGPESDRGVGPNRAPPGQGDRYRHARWRPCSAAVGGLAVRIVVARRWLGVVRYRNSPTPEQRADVGDGATLSGRRHDAALQRRRRVLARTETKAGAAVATPPLAVGARRNPPLRSASGALTPSDDGELPPPGGIFGHPRRRSPVGTLSRPPRHAGGRGRRRHGAGDAPRAAVSCSSDRPTVPEQHSVDSAPLAYASDRLPEMHAQSDRRDDADHNTRIMRVLPSGRGTRHLEASNRSGGDTWPKGHRFAAVRWPWRTAAAAAAAQRGRISDRTAAGAGVRSGMRAGLGRPFRQVRGVLRRASRSRTASGAPDAGR
jgi:hypothetical protein